MEILFFFGSGISFPTGLPSVYDITNSVLNDTWFDNSDENFYKGENPSNYLRPQNLVPRIQEFLKIIKNYSDTFYRNKNQNPTNYEDLFYICKQITDNETGEIDNPAIVFFIDYLKFTAKSLFKPLPMRKEYKLDLNRLADRSCDFISCVVWDCLGGEKKPIGLTPLIDLIKAGENTRIDIATLNHDLLIETILDENNIPFIDGFAEADGDVRYFSPDKFSDNSKIRLFKLHGSLNWHRYRLHDKKNNVTIDKYGMSLNKNFNYSKNSKGEDLLVISQRPIFLIGSYNKLYSYNFGIFRMINKMFDNILYEYDLIVMSGYGWNDKGINGLLFQWLRSDIKRKILLLHENPEIDIKQKSKSAMWHSYDDLVKEGKLVPIKKWFSEINTDEINQITN